ncbi:MAG: hypothetical protein U0930_03060 [Pirellulales bacterium]
MAESTENLKSKGGKRRWIVFCLIGVALFACTMWMAVKMPVIGYQAMFNPQSEMVDVSTLSQVGHIRRSIEYNIVEDYFFVREKNLSLLSPSLSQPDDKLPSRVFLTVPNATDKPIAFTGKLESRDSNGVQQEYPFQTPANPQLIGRNLLACIPSSDQLVTLDIVSGKLQSATLQLPAGKVCIFLPITLQISSGNNDSSRQFICVYENNATAGGANATTAPFIAELFQVDGDGELTNVWSKPLYGQASVEALGDKIYLVGQSAKDVECFSAQDGQFLSKLAIPQEAQDLLASAGTANRYIGLDANTISFTSGNSRSFFYRLEDMFPLKSPENVSYLTSVKDHEDLVLIAEYVDDKIWLSVLSIRDNTALWRRPFKNNIISYDQSGGRATLISQDFGGTFEVIDQITGQTLHRRQPMAWFVWALPLMALCGAIWSWRLSNYCGCCARSQWLGFVALSIFFLGPLCFHLLWWGYDLWPLELHQYLQGFIVAALTASIATFVYRAERLVIRSIPVIAIIVCLILLVRGMISSDALASEAVVTTILSCAPTALVFLCIRWLPTIFRRSTPERTSVLKMPMRDLFLASTLAACVLGAAVPLIRSAQINQFWNSNFQMALVAEAVLVVSAGVILLVQLANWRWLMILLIAGLLTAVLYEGLYPFVTTKQLFSIARNSYPSVLFRVFGTAILVLPFLLRLILKPAPLTVPSE